MKENDTPRHAINNTLFDRVTNLCLLRSTVHKYMNRNLQTQDSTTKDHAR